MMFRLAFMSLVLAASSTGQVIQDAYLKASNTDADDRFGFAVATWGDTFVVSAPLEDSAATGVNGDQADNGAEASGAVYVFVRDGADWIQQAYLKASNAGEADIFGSSVAIHGDTLVVGAEGEDSSATGVGGDEHDDSAFGSGAVYVFVRQGTTWAQQAYIKASNTGSVDEFGGAVALWADTLVVGALYESSGAAGVDGDQDDNSAANAGAAYVFVRNGTAWTQQAYLKASNPGGGAILSGDHFGGAVDVWGDTIAVGATDEDSRAVGVNGDQANDDAPDSGAAYVFVRDGSTWTQQAYIKASNTDGNDKFGSSLALWDDALIVTAPFERSAATGVDGDQDDDGVLWAGAAYVLAREGTSWSHQAYLKASNTGAADLFGDSVDVWGDTVVIGAHIEDGVAGDQGDVMPDSGAAYVFGRNGTTWMQQGYLKASNVGQADWFGSSAALSADTLLVGADGEAGGVFGIDGDQDDDTAIRAGAAYVFDLGTAECLLVVGDGPGGASHYGIGHVFDTQLDGVEDSYEVELDDIPEFVLPVPAGRRDVRHADPLGHGTLTATSLGDGPVGQTPLWMLDGDFAVQVLMWNPEVFPGLPEQYTAGLYVSIQPDGSVATTPYGDDVGGLAVWHEIDVNAAGQIVIRFPFSIPGF